MGFLDRITGGGNDDSSDDGGSDSSGGGGGIVDNVTDTVEDARDAASDAVDSVTSGGSSSGGSSGGTSPAGPSVPGGGDDGDGSGGNPTRNTGGSTSPAGPSAPGGSSGDSSGGSSGDSSGGSDGGSDDSGGSSGGTNPVGPSVPGAGSSGGGNDNPTRNTGGSTSPAGPSVPGGSSVDSSGGSSGDTSGGSAGGSEDSGGSPSGPGGPQPESSDNSETSDSGTSGGEQANTGAGDNQQNTGESGERPNQRTTAFEKIQAQTDAVLDRSDVEIERGDGQITAELTESGIQEEAAAQSDQFSESDFLVGRNGEVFLSADAQAEQIAEQDPDLSADDVLIQQQRADTGQVNSSGDLAGAISGERPTDGEIVSTITLTDEGQAAVGPDVPSAVQDAGEAAGADPNELAEEGRNARDADTGEAFGGRGGFESGARNAITGFEETVVDPAASGTGDAFGALDEFGRDVSIDDGVGNNNDGAIGLPNEQQAEGAVQGVGSLPRLALAPIEAGEFAAEGAQSIAAASPAVEGDASDTREFGQRTAAVGAATAADIFEAGQSNPDRFFGRLGGSAVGTAGAIRAGRAVGGASGARTAAGIIQPGEEIALAARRAVPTSGLRNIGASVRARAGEFRADDSAQLGRSRAGERDTGGSVVDDDILESVRSTDPNVGEGNRLADAPGESNARSGPTGRRTERGGSQARRDARASSRAEIDNQFADRPADFTSKTFDSQQGRTTQSRDSGLIRGPENRLRQAQESRVFAGEGPSGVLDGLLGVTGATAGSGLLEESQISSAGAATGELRGIAEDTGFDIDTGLSVGIGPETNISSEPGLRSEAGARSETGQETGLEVRTESRSESRLENRSELRSEQRSESRRRIESRIEGRAESRRELRRDDDEDDDRELGLTAEGGFPSSESGNTDGAATGFIAETLTGFGTGGLDVDAAEAAENDNSGFLQTEAQAEGSKGFEAAQDLFTFGEEE